MPCASQNSDLQEWSLTPTPPLGLVHTSLRATKLSGAVVNGPAQDPLLEYKVAHVGGELFVFNEVLLRSKAFYAQILLSGVPIGPHIAIDAQ